jgi:hypothetical protein
MAFNMNQFTQGFAQGADIYTKLSSLHMQRQQMEQQQRQQEIQNDMAFFTTALSIVTNKDMPRAQKQQAMQVLGNTVGKYFPEKLKSLSSFNFEDNKEAIEIGKSLYNNLTDKSIPLEKQAVLAAQHLDDLVALGEDIAREQAAVNTILQMQAQETAHKRDTAAREQQARLEHEFGMQRIAEQGAKELDVYKAKKLFDIVTEPLTKTGTPEIDEKRLKFLKDSQASITKSVDTILKKHNVGNIDFALLVSLSDEAQLQYLKNQTKTAAEKITGEDKPKLDRYYEALDKIAAEVIGGVGLVQESGISQEPGQPQKIVEVGIRDGKRVVKYEDGREEIID